MTHTPQIFLASTSFQRKELFRWLGIPFTVIAPEFEEQKVPIPEDGRFDQYVETLAFGKAVSKAESVQGLILSADTIVEFDQQVFGKPKDIAHAREMLHTFAGKSHRVWTGICLFDTSTQESLLTSIQSIVTFKPLTSQEIERYIDTGEPLGKAGSYSLGGQAKKLIASVEGSTTNVIGLPLLTVVQLLRKKNIQPPSDLSKIISQHLGVSS